LNKSFAHILRQQGIDYKSANCAVDLKLPGGASARVRVRCSEGEHFSLRHSDINGSIDLLVYVWNAEDEAEIFIITPCEAINFLGERALKTKSWIEQKYYKWSSATGLPKAKRQEFIDRFQGRGNDILALAQRKSKNPPPPPQNLAVSNNP
jgi:hypothetical protein